MEYCKIYDTNGNDSKISAVDLRQVLTFTEENRDDVVLAWLDVFKSAEYKR